MELISPLYDRALHLAAQAHRSQLRKQTSIPYITHPFIVSSLVERSQGDETAILGGLLHDTLEDTDTSYSLLQTSFGDGVASLVAALTQPVDVPSKQEERAAKVRQAVRFGPSALAIKVADTIHNSYSCLRVLHIEGEAFWQHMGDGRAGTLAYYRHIVATAQEQGITPELVTALERQVDAIEQWNGALGTPPSDAGLQVLGFSRRLHEAVAFAAIAHRAQERKTSHVPYIVHPLAVAHLVWQAGRNEDAVIAALLHDVTEDCDVPFAEIGEQFGPRVEQLVEALSYPSDMRQGRRTLMLEKLEAGDTDVAIIKAADSLHNLFSLLDYMPTYGMRVWDAYTSSPATTMNYYRRILDGVQRKVGDAPIVRDFSFVLDTLARDSLV